MNRNIYTETSWKTLFDMTKLCSSVKNRKKKCRNYNYYSSIK